ncbi:MAG TPA: 3'-5' exonuclease [Thermoleophilaceae bacterium]|nr:3'-5' exonuclease [Thermoleophilaceae bacterium]
MKLAGRTHWRDAPFAVVDVETTGLDPATDEVISFAAVPVNAGRVVAGQAVTGLVRPASSPPAASVEIHGLRAADLAGAPAGPEALAPLVSALQGRVPVVHVAWVERSFLTPRLRRLGYVMPRRMVDTALLWRVLCMVRGEDDPGYCALETVAAGLGLPSHRPHEAEGDALTTAQAFLALATHFDAHRRATVGRLARARWELRAMQLWHPSRAANRG